MLNFNSREKHKYKKLMITFYTNQSNSRNKLIDFSLELKNKIFLDLGLDTIVRI